MYRIQESQLAGRLDELEGRLERVIAAVRTLAEATLERPGTR